METFVPRSMVFLLTFFAGPFRAASMVACALPQHSVLSAALFSFGFLPVFIANYLVHRVYRTGLVYIFFKQPKIQYILINP